MAQEPHISIDSAKGGYRCHMWGGNGKLVWWSQTYDYKSSAKEAVEFLQYWAPRVQVYDRT